MTASIATSGQQQRSCTGFCRAKATAEQQNRKTALNVWSCGVQRGERCFDMAVHIRLCKLRCNADRIQDRVFIRRSMADDAGSTHTQQWRSAVFRGIKTALEGLEGAAAQQCAYLGRN